MLNRPSAILKYSLLSVYVLVCLNSAVLAGPAQFDFKDPKANNTVLLLIDSPLEPVVATASGISGSVLFDPKEPRKSSGKIVVDAKSIQFPNAGFTATAHGPDGFDVQRFPTIEFAIKELKDLKSSGSTHKATVVGDFTCRGVTKRLAVNGTVNYLPGKAHERSRTPGDLIVLRFAFRVNRRDFGVKPTRGDSLVGDDVEVRVSIVGTAPSS